MPNHQSATLPPGDDFAGEVDGPLTAPAGDQPVDFLDVAGVGAFTAVLRGYDIEDRDVNHALRLLRSLFHGFATLQASDGFQWSTDVDDSFEWLIAFTDRGLRTL